MKSLTGPSRAARRRRLYKKAGGFCHWCGVQTYLPELRRGRPIERMGTIDHLDPRTSSLRGFFTEDGVQRTVLACWKCNNERSRIQATDPTVTIPPSVLHATPDKRPGGAL